MVVSNNVASITVAIVSIESQFVADNRLYRRAIDASSGQPVAVDVTEATAVRLERALGGAGGSGGWSFWSYFSIAVASLLAAVLLGVLLVCAWIMCGHWLRRTLLRNINHTTASGAGGGGSGGGMRGSAATSGDASYIPTSPYAPSTLGRAPLEHDLSAYQASPNYYRSPLRPASAYHSNVGSPRDAAFTPGLVLYVLHTTSAFPFANNNHFFVYSRLLYRECVNDRRASKNKKFWTQRSQSRRRNLKLIYNRNNTIEFNFNISSNQHQINK
jgi:hypothetical protein